MNVVRIERFAIVQGSSIQYVGEEMGAEDKATRAVQYLLLCGLTPLTNGNKREHWLRKSVEM